MRGGSWTAVDHQITRNKGEYMGLGGNKRKSAVSLADSDTVNNLLLHMAAIDLRNSFHVRGVVDLTRIPNNTAKFSPCTTMASFSSSVNEPTCISYSYTAVSNNVAATQLMA